MHAKNSKICITFPHKEIKSYPNKNQNLFRGITFQMMAIKVSQSHRFVHRENK